MLLGAAADRPGLGLRGSSLGGAQDFLRGLLRDAAGRAAGSGGACAASTADRGKRREPAREDGGRQPDRTSPEWDRYDGSAPGLVAVCRPILSASTTRSARMLGLAQSTILLAVRVRHGSEVTLASQDRRGDLGDPLHVRRGPGLNCRSTKS